MINQAVVGYLKVIQASRQVGAQNGGSKVANEWSIEANNTVPTAHLPDRLPHFSGPFFLLAESLQFAFRTKTPNYLLLPARPALYRTAFKIRSAFILKRGTKLIELLCNKWMHKMTSHLVGSCQKAK